MLLPDPWPSSLWHQGKKQHSPFWRIKAWIKFILLHCLGMISKIQCVCVFFLISQFPVFWLSMATIHSACFIVSFQSCSIGHFFMSSEIQLLFLYSNIWLLISSYLLKKNKTGWKLQIQIAYQVRISVLGFMLSGPSLKLKFYFSSYSCLIFFFLPRNTLWVLSHWLFWIRFKMLDLSRKLQSNLCHCWCSLIFSFPLRPPIQMVSIFFSITEQWSGKAFVWSDCIWGLLLVAHLTAALPKAAYKMVQVCFGEQIGNISHCWLALLQTIWQG